ncbi:DsrE family protein [Aneurinibacillus migulanus]|uniref:DsrE family protein n=1 Tax=Aneurinibacillus migulanus TaxID=47500 RepID=UPI0020A0E721|nr:DsrE family protein [Aneurinibacillus migulanus]MCP1354064.1 DsrE family protein [Aneurinibacillus migulanus]
MAKSVAVIIEHSPMNTHRTSEGLRMSVGLVLGKHDVQVLLFGEAAPAALPTTPALVSAHELQKHIKALVMLKRRVIAEAEALNTLGLTESELLKGVERMPRTEMIRLVREADAVFRY